MGNVQDPHQNTTQVHLHFYPVDQRVMIIHRSHNALPNAQINKILDNLHLTTTEYKLVTETTSVSATEMNPFSVCNQQLQGGRRERGRERVKG